MDNFIKIYLVDAKKNIEAQHITSDNKAYHIRNDKQETIKFLLSRGKINETEIKEARKILGIKS